MRWTGYGENMWGLTASDGSADVELDFAGEKRRSEHTRRAASGCEHSWTTARSRPRRPRRSIAFAPEIVVPAVEEMYRRYGEHIFGKYGFYDAFNPSFTYDVPLRARPRVAGVRLGGHRLPRHRSGSHPGDDRELSHRPRVARDRGRIRISARARAGRLHWRLAQPAPGSRVAPQRSKPLALDSLSILAATALKLRWRRSVAPQDAWHRKAVRWRRWLGLRLTLRVLALRLDRFCSAPARLRASDHADHAFLGDGARRRSRRATAPRVRAQESRTSASKCSRCHGPRRTKSC